MERRRLTAKIASIAEIVSGKFVHKGGFESSYVLTSLGRRLSRVRVLGLVVDKFSSPDGKYATITIDDGSDTIRCKAFVNVKLFERIAVGDLVHVFGKVREYDDEIYIIGEIVRVAEPNAEILRLLELKAIHTDQEQKIKKIKQLLKSAVDAAELKKAAAEFMSAEDVEGIVEAVEAFVEHEADAAEAKDKVLQLIRELDTGQGADYQQLLEKSGLPETAVESVITELLSAGVCFESRPGKIKCVSV
jgi:RPA family protein